ncbi:MAG: hypothetical protein EKK63_14685 [Acinetobacter sp.]|uniref:hypothetical protein n=1 Tax=Acinetobacter sp. TaxID=472 RepID=UPI000FA048C2|nr:hypothetical protein [Acinetobacter sp.]RUP37512.1 MAG: hypothetical protein EKK63_14685 [Acinetobacter sp.]
MKKFITPSYTFSPGVSGIGQITISVDSFDIKKLIAVINTTRGVLIYNPVSLTTGLHSTSENVVILKADTSTHDSVDILQIIYEDDSSDQNAQASLDTAILLLANIAEKMARLDVNDRMAVNIETGSVGVSSLPTLANVTTVATVTTVSNLTNLNNFSGGNAAPLPYHMSNIGAAHIYNQIEFS